MSKAFAPKDGETENETDLLPGGQEKDDQDSVPRGTKNYMTPPGAERLRSELTRLIKVDRPEVVRTVSWAASNGDRSENGDYIYGKRRLREIDRRIRFLTRRLDSAEIVDPATQKSDRVLFGATVLVSDENGQKKTYSIVGIDETDVRRGLVSWISPIGKALLQGRVGDAVTVMTPESEIELVIEKITYQPIAI
ncbi:MAG: transcription elongation factor GreB [Bdellovibrionales bacterium]|nr:transcription elongation factor GreB [Bdellovibrionales bacterium]